MTLLKLCDPGTLTPSAKLSAGTLELGRIGVTLGHYWAARGKAGARRQRVLNAGEMRLGTSASWLGLSFGLDLIFLARAGRLWRVPGVRLPSRVLRPERDDAASWRAWADTYARAVVDRLGYRNETMAMDRGQRRYRLIVRTLVNERVLEAAELGFTLDAEALAAGVCESWDSQDLMRPRYATVQHALYVALVLALDLARASELLELAGLLEYRVGFINRDAAAAIYASASRVLGVLSPAWAARGYLTPWHMEGSIDRHMRAHYVRTMNAAIVRQVPIDVAAGLRLDGLTGDSLSDELARAHEGFAASFDGPDDPDSDDPDND